MSQQQMDFTAKPTPPCKGFYWLLGIESGDFTIARWDGDLWWLIGAGGPLPDHLVRAHQLIGDRIEVPDAVQVTLEALS